MSLVGDRDASSKTLKGGGDTETLTLVARGHLGEAHDVREEDSDEPPAGGIPVAGHERSYNPFR